MSPPGQTPDTIALPSRRPVTEVRSERPARAQDPVVAENGARTGPEDPPYRLDDQVGYLLRLANQRHTVIFQDRAILALTPTQFSAMIRIAEAGSCSQNHLGRLIAVDAATIKGVVDRLRTKRLVRLEKDPNDGRRNLISLTPQGRDRIRSLRTMGQRVSDATLAPLRPDERAVLLDLLRKLV